MTFDADNEYLFTGVDDDEDNVDDDVDHDLECNKQRRRGDDGRR